MEDRLKNLIKKSVFFIYGILFYIKSKNVINKIKLKGDIVVVGGGEAEKNLRTDQFIIAVNSGLCTCVEMDIQPDILIVDDEVFYDSEKDYRSRTAHALINLKPKYIIKIKTSKKQLSQSLIEDLKQTYCGTDLNINRWMRRLIANSLSPVTRYDFDGASKISTGTLTFIILNLLNINKFNAIGFTLFTSTFSKVKLHPFSNKIADRKMSHFYSDNCAVFDLAMRGTRINFGNKILKNTFGN